MVAAAWAALLAVPAAAADTKFTTSWKAPGATGRQIAGQKVVVVALGDDQALRTSAEEAMARTLTAHGVTGEASSRVIPAEELRDRAKASAWLKSHDVKAVVTLRVIAADTIKTYSPVVWTTEPKYRSFVDYYASGGGAPATTRVTQEPIVALELLLFTVQDGGLAWAGTCQVKNPPKAVDEFAARVVDAAVKQLRSVGLLARPAKKK